MKKFYFFIVISTAFCFTGFSQYGSFASAVYIENNGVTQFYNCDAHGTGNAIGSVQFTGSLGTFTENSGLLKIRGAEIKTWKGSNGNVCTPKLNYRVTPPLGGAFSQFDINFYCNCSGSSFSPSCGGGPCGNNDQKWQTPGSGAQSNIDLTTFTPGTYELEVYYDIPGNSNGTSGCSNNITDNNSGSNYKMTFVIVAPLPVKFKEINVKGHNVSNEISWSTASETNNDYFEVQHSNDGRHFQTVGQVKGYGNSNEERAYTFSHETQGNTISFYRLKQVDFDGKYHYSSIVSVRSTKDRFLSPFSLSPNPTRDFVYVFGVEKNASYTIMDFSGRQLLAGTFDLGQTIDVSSLQGGFYMLSLKESDFVSSFKLIKQ